MEYNVDKKKLKEVFRLAGRLVRVDLHLDKDGRSRGFAIVEYDHPVEAVQAISMFHNQVLNDRAMSVRIDRANETLKLPDGLKGIGMGLGSNGEPLRDVARNLPSLTSSTPSNNGGAGILGAVPNQALQVASALSGLNSVVGGSGLGNLGANSSVLQANLAGMTNLLGGNLGNNDLSLTSSLINPLVQSNSQLGSLGGSGGSGQLGSNSNNPNNQPFGRDSGSYGNNQDNSFNQGHNYNSGRGGYQNYDSKNSNSGGGGGGGGAGYGYGGGNNNRDNFGSLGGGNLGNLGGSLLRGQHSSGNNKDGGFSRKVLISNVSSNLFLFICFLQRFFIGLNLQLPGSASYKMLSEKFNEFGDVQHLEEKGSGSMLIVYAADWQAERAISILLRFFVSRIFQILS